jgi:hypothetical protein
MRTFDLRHHDTEDFASWKDVQSLMDKIQSGEEGLPHFELWEPDDGNLIIGVDLVDMDDTQAWLLTRRENSTKHFLAKGTGDRYYPCVYSGCPEFVRDCCLLSRSDAECAIATLLERQKLHIDWHWVPVTSALERLSGGVT